MPFSIYDLRLTIFKSGAAERKRPNTKERKERNTGKKHNPNPLPSDGRGNRCHSLLEVLKLCCRHRQTDFVQGGVRFGTQRKTILPLSGERRGAGKCKSQFSLQSTRNGMRMTKEVYQLRYGSASKAPIKNDEYNLRKMQVFLIKRNLLHRRLLWGGPAAGSNFKRSTRGWRQCSRRS